MARYNNKIFDADEEFEKFINSKNYFPPMQTGGALLETKGMELPDDVFASVKIIIGASYNIYDQSRSILNSLVAKNIITVETTFEDVNCNNLLKVLDIYHLFYICILIF